MSFSSSARMGFIVAILLVANLAAQEPRDESANARIEGTVMLAGTGLRFAGAEIDYQRYDGVWTYFNVLKSDAAGRFEAPHLKAGRYRIYVSAPGYVDAKSTIEVAAGERKEVRLELARLASIEGRAVDAEGRPRAGVSIQLLHYGYIFGERWVEITNITHTDDRGLYRLHWISPGRYYVLAGASVTPFPVSGPNGNANAVSAHDVSPVFYPDTPAIEPDSPEHSRAAAITVKPADDLTGIDFVLPRFQPRTIRGRLIAATGRLPGSVPLQLGAVSPEGSWTAFDAPIDYDEQTGEFEMRNVPPGPYRLIGAAIMAGEIPVLVRDADIEGLVISAATRSTIHGRLTVEGPIDNRVGQGIQVRLIRRDGSPATPLLSRPVAEGEFSVERVFPGEYLVGLSCVSTPCGAYLKQVRFGGVDATREPIVVLANSDSTLDITVSLNGARVQGTVVDEKLRPVPFARIIFMPRLHPDRFDLYLRVSGTESGEFRLDGFTPGDYKIFVWDRETGDEASGDDPPYEDPAFVREHERDGKEAHFNEGANGSITLKVLR